MVVPLVDETTPNIGLTKDGQAFATQVGGTTDQELLAPTFPLHVVKLKPVRM